MKKIILILLIYLIYAKSADAQSKIINESVKESLSKGFAFSNQIQEKFWNFPPEKRNLLFSLIIEVDNSGEVSSVKFNRNPNRMDSLISRNRIQTYLNKEKRKHISNYKNCIFILPCWIKDYDLRWIDLKFQDLKDFDELIPEIESLNTDKKVIVLPPLKYFVTQPRS